MRATKETEARKKIRARVTAFHAMRKTMDREQFKMEGYAAELEELRVELTAMNALFRQREHERQASRVRIAS
jgi:predicted nuclease with TOPRIM domain